MATRRLAGRVIGAQGRRSMRCPISCSVRMKVKGTFIRQRKEPCQSCTRVPNTTRGDAGPRGGGRTMDGSPGSEPGTARRWCHIVVLQTFLKNYISTDTPHSDSFGDPTWLAVERSLRPSWLAFSRPAAQAVLRQRLRTGHRPMLPTRARRDRSPRPSRAPHRRPSRPPQARLRIQNRPRRRRRNLSHRSRPA